MRGREIKLGKLSDKERGYLFGLFEGDGYKIYDKKNRHYHVEFYLNSRNDKKIIGFLIMLLKKIGLNPNLYQDKRYNCKRIRVYSKKLFNVINKNIRTKDKNKDFMVGFVSGMIDSEGYVNNKKYYILIINTNRNIINECKRFLGSIGIKSSLGKRKFSKKDKKDSYRFYISVNFKRVKHISLKAGELSQRGGNIKNVA